MSLKRLIKKLPYSVQQSVKYIYGAIPPSIRYGKVFWETYKFLEISQWWSREKLEEYQIQQLKELLHHAYENVPYYRKALDERGLKPKDIQEFNDLRKLPYLTKDIFKEHFNKFVAKNIKLNSLSISHTSGTSGKPLQFYTDESIMQRELAYIYHQWSRVGVEPGVPMVQLRGATIERKKPIDYDPMRKVLRLSPRIDNKEIASYYIEKINQFGAKFLHGYPSAIAIFALLIKQHGFSVPFKLNAVLFASEAVYLWQREITEEVFKCRIFSHYGIAEQVVLAGDCENTYYYHCIPQYGITEIDTENNEIIGTGFLNNINPFIRYRTTDVASQSSYSGCSKCGRQYIPIFSSVEGRLEDFIITPKEVLISPAVITHPFKDFKTIKNSQIVQGNVNEVILKIVPWDDCDQTILMEELKLLCQGFQTILGSDMNIRAEIVESIPLSKTGKFKWIISEVSKDFLEKGIK